MKKLFILVLLIAAVAVAAPFGLGFEIEHRYRVLMAQFEDAGYKMTAHDYQRGLFESSASTDFSIPVISTDGQNQSIDLTLVSQVSHGPFTPSRGWFGQLARIDTQILHEGKAVFPAALNASLQTDLMFSGDGQSRLNLPALTEPMMLDGGAQLSFSGFSGLVDFNVVKGHLSMTFDSDGLAISSPGQGRLIVNGIRGQSESNRSIEDLMLGDGQLTIDLLTLNDQQSGFALNLKGLEIAAETTAAENTVDMLIRYAVNQVELPTEKLGRSVIELEFTSIDAKALAAIQQGIKDFQKDDSGTDEQKMAALMGVFMAATPSLLQRDPAINIKNFEVSTPSGILMADFSLGTRGMTIVDMNSPLAALPKVVAAATLTLPENLVREAFFDYLKPSVAVEIAMNAKEGEDLPDVDVVTRERVDAQLQSFLDQQLVKRDGDKLVTAAAIKDGKMTVNGQAIGLPPM